MSVLGDLLKDKLDELDRSDFSLQHGRKALPLPLFLKRKREVREFIENIKRRKTQEESDPYGYGYDPGARPRHLDLVEWEVESANERFESMCRQCGYGEGDPRRDVVSLQVMRGF